MDLVEARELAHEVVETAGSGREFAQREGGERACPAGPEEQREVREVAAHDEDADELVHGPLDEKAERGRRAPPPRLPH